jgi:glucokinase
MVYRLWTPLRCVLMMRRQWAIGIDFGGTNIKCGLVDRRGRVAASVSLPTRAFARPRAFIEGTARTVERLARSAGVRTTQLRGVGVGAPGLVDRYRGVVHSLVNVPGWRDVPLARRLRARLRVPVLVDNDVNLVALGEWRWGAGRGAQSLVCLTLGTGVGGGLVIGGRLYRGARGAAGEIGHMAIDAQGPRCGCGRRGCLEALVGTAAILRLGRGAMARSSRLRALVRASHGRLMPRLIGRAARSGDPAARQVWVEIGRRLGVGLANLANLLNPECIVIGGGVSNNWTSFAPTMRKTLRAEAMDVPGRTVRVVRTALGDRAGIIGAAVLVWEER